MKVVSGTAKGRNLKGFSDHITRPTSSQVKESMMNIVQFEISGAKVLDLFAGTGQLGIEALSRGALSCDFVDSDSKCIQIIKENLTHTQLINSSIVINLNVENWLKSANHKYDIIFLDPPYGKEIIPNLLNYLVDITSDSGTIVCECEKSDLLPETLGGFSKSKDYKYGKRKINIYRKSQFY